MNDIDIQIGTEFEGDIKLTSNLLDDYGNVRTVRVSTKDINGNPIIVEKGVKDIAFISDIPAEKQLIYSRLNTQNPDWYVFPTIGADLESFIGEPNTSATADDITRSILLSLTHRDPITGVQFYTIDDMDVSAIPVDIDKILIFVKFPDNTIYLNFNYNYGIEEIGTL